MEATDELYNSCKWTIEKACINAYRRNPIISLDDYRSYANEVFMDAVRSFNPAAGTKFNSWLTTQLLRLKKYAARGGAMVSDSNYDSNSLVLSMDRMGEAVDGRNCTLHDVRQPVNDQYSESIATPSWDFDWWKRMDNLKPYLGELSEDARTMVDDILDGNTAKVDEAGNIRPEHGARHYDRLSPRQLYVRLYCKRGWDLERVKEARVEIEDMLRRWAPCRLPEMEREQRMHSVSIRLERDGVLTAKSEATWDRTSRTVSCIRDVPVQPVHTQDELF